MSEQPVSEFSHVVKLTDVGNGATKLKLEANPAQRSALAERFELLALNRLEAEITLSGDDKGVWARGQMRATLTQACIATAEPVATDIDEPVTMLFVPEPQNATDAEIELEADDCDTMFHDGRTVDLGEAIAQTLGLALNPYPRSPTAEAALQAAGVISEESAQEESSPFAALAALKGKLKQ